jgi:hypothetical protein
MKILLAGPHCSSCEQAKLELDIDLDHGDTSHAVDKESDFMYHQSTICIDNVTLFSSGGTRC